MEWNESEKKILITKNDKRVSFFVGSEKYDINGKEYIAPTAPIVVDDRTYIPVRILAKALGMNIYWREEYGLVVIGPKKLPFNKKEEAAVDCLHSILG